MSLAFAGAFSLPLPTFADDCRHHVGSRVFLASYSSDPSVFVWDKRSRLVAYAAAGGYDGIDNVTRHTILVRPGTRAIVAMCRPSAVRRRYIPESFDAVGIKITAGANRNHWGWVSSDDVHSLK